LHENNEARGLFDPLKTRELGYTPADTPGYQKLVSPPLSNPSRKDNSADVFEFFSFLQWRKGRLGVNIGRRISLL
jgi:hypothetical protein